MSAAFIAGAIRRCNNFSYASTRWQIRQLSQITAGSSDKPIRGRGDTRGGAAEVIDLLIA